MQQTPGVGRSLFDGKRQPRHHGVRVVVTGQVGVDKKPFLNEVVRLAAANGHDVKLFNVGDRMYAEAPDISPGRILDLPKQRLTSLRRSVFKDALVSAEAGDNIIVNTHATFRWKHGLFHAYDHEQMARLDADLYVILVDNVDAIHERLTRSHRVRHTLKDILVWREEEIVVTEAMAEAVSGFGCSYVIARENTSVAPQSLYRLMFEQQRKRVYPSFPMTHVLELPAVMNEIESFRASLAEHFITFDPADLDEKRLLYDAGEATKRGEQHVDLSVNGRTISIPVMEISQIAHDIDAQIYARDFKLIDQSDMIVSYIPVLADGRPALSSGVERELQHTFESTKEVFVIWRADCEPSPFVTETATQVFHTLSELFDYFQNCSYIGDHQLRLD